ncbi:MAG: hypothetical protein JJU25_14365 [Halomonas sp.]|nr:hypothetical protein [Halomonas sp.]MCC5883801.1 hypothetical protein [Halomonas sp.]
MIKPASLNELFSLLNEMTLAKHRENAFSPSKNFQLAEHTLIISYLSSLLVLVALIFYTREFDTSPQANQAAFLLYIINIGLSITYLLTIIIGIAIILWKQRKNPYSAIMQRLNHDLHGDLPFLSQLQKFDTSTLQYALIQYRQSWGISENRVSLLAGNLRKLGLFPALAAASISASTLMKEGTSFPLWLPIILAAAFSIIGFIALGQRERPQQVIELLEYAIETSKGIDIAETGGDKAKESNYQQRSATVA